MIICCSQIAAALEIIEKKIWVTSILFRGKPSKSVETNPKYDP